MISEISQMVIVTWTELVTLRLRVRCRRQFDIQKVFDRLMIWLSPTKLISNQHKDQLRLNREVFYQDDLG